MASAKELAVKLVAQTCGSDPCKPDGAVCRCRDDIEASITQARQAALEEAAKVAQGCGDVSVDDKSAQIIAEFKLRRKKAGQGGDQPSDCVIFP